MSLAVVLHTQVSDLHRAITPAAVSVGSATVSWFASTLPFVQWVAAVVAIVSGLLGMSWVAFQFYHAWKAKQSKR